MDIAGAADVVKDSNAADGIGEQFLPPVIERGRLELESAGPRQAWEVARLREDLDTLREEIAAIDRRDAAQHGGLKGEIAHLVRRIARLEALPKARQGR